MPFPTNLDTLNDEEQAIRRRSKDAIEVSEDLRLHCRAIEAAMNLMHHLPRNAPHANEDDLVIRRLGFRFFNSMASAVSAMLTGYYQTSVMVVRDVLENHFLVDYFSTDRSLIAVWRASEEKVRSKLFAPARIRTVLDDRDGFTLRKREEHYKLLCSMGAHASMQGFRLLEPALDGFSQCGPFFSLVALEATAAEIAKVIAGAAGQYTLWFANDSVTDHYVKLHFAEAYEDWMCRFYGKPPNPEMIAAMRRAWITAEREEQSAIPPAPVGPC